MEKFGAGEVTVDGQNLRSLVLGVPPLVDAAVLVDGGAAPSSRRPRGPRAEDAAAPLTLAIHSGAAAGTVIPLRRGSYSIGRSGTRIVIPDPELSREHARVVVTDTDILLIDLDSANGTYVDGERIRNAVISTDSSFRCGQSNMSLLIPDALSGVLEDAGRSVAEPLLVVGRLEAGNRAVLVLTAILPLLMGVVLAVATGMWMFLAFSGASSLSVLVPALAGRRQRRDLAAAVKTAVQKDRERRRRCAPSLAFVALAAQRGSRTPVSGPGTDGVWLRLGEAEQPANVRIEPVGTGAPVPAAGIVPLLLEPGRPITRISGSPTALDGAIRSLLMQLAGYPCAGTTQVLVHGHAADLPLAARYLPRVTLTATTPAAIQAVSSPHPFGCERGVLLIRGKHPVAAGELSVCEAAMERGWQILLFLPEGAGALAPDVYLSENRSVRRENLTETPFVPDLVPEDVFSTFCRRAAGAGQKQEGQARTVPATCTLYEVLPLTLAATTERWESSARNEGLAVPLGRSASGTKTMDLQADGPHLLVAGTTGSGKSELLRSLTLALALSYPPERVNFLFIDFKGGSGLGPLSGLVHCVGLQTDLSASEMERTLTSLRAEVRLREECLAAARVPDIAAYRSTRAAKDFVLPSLVIVIDEFRMLVDDAPEVLRELLRIASIGRSLGIHLIMATQRPQGALTADIRANVTSSIALRVQSDMESTDIINSKAAAAISVDAPGRAFLARGTEAAEEFQAASLGLLPAGRHPPAVTVQTALAHLCSESTDDAGGAPSAGTPAQAVEPLAAMVRSLCAAQQKEVPRRPVAPPLPDELSEPAPDKQRASSAATPGSCYIEPVNSEGHIRVGVLDVPEKQRVEPLVWSPAHHGHAAFIGSPLSGAGAALELAVHKLMARSDEAHLYILDAQGSFLPLASESRTGAHAGLSDLRRGVRVLERLVRELGLRLSQPASHQVPLVLIISGWGSWVSAFRSGPLAWAEDLVQDLVRDGARAGITMLIFGERELVTARFFGALPNRFYFPATSTEESRAMWPRLPSVTAVIGRAVAFGPVANGGPAICQFYRSPGPHLVDRSGAGHPTAISPPFRVEPLPAKITVRQVQELMATAELQPPSLQFPAGKEPAGGTLHSGPRGTAGRQRDVVLGVAGDEPAAAGLRIPGGGVTAILGNPGSGKSNTLHALYSLNPAQPWFTCPVQSEAAGDVWKDLLEQAEGGRLPPETVLLVDDIDLLAPQAVRALDQLNALGHSLIVTAAYSPVLFQRAPLIMNARAAGAGLLLAPRSMADGDLFGVRFEIEADAPPGRGVLISAGRSCPLQVAWASAIG
ncbi:hypothetical protein GCM10007170_28600 [Arthrobacter liuii]|uniref:DNA segregation ATPase FtsK/SpoIIIE, S-DNA-T family n=2 Tax=Arthrobacter liuii TaxID=1476996 RepID=A0ABQ2AU97_9MICC|nr:hypothetical protein GCM10007170_28600 [Arthrobacter liuii]